MADPMKTNEASRKKQFTVMAITIVVIGVGLVLMKILHHPKAQKVDQKSLITTMDSPMDDDMVESSLNQTVREDESRIKRLTSKLNGFMKRMETSITTMTQRLDKDEKVQHQLKTLNTPNGYSSHPQTGTGLTTRARPSSPASSAMPATKPLLKIARLTFEKPKLKKLDLSDQVTPGTYARAVLLSCADTNAGVDGQTNTIPVNLRFVNNGTLPNGYHSSLKGCFAIASAYWSISSERGEIRLKRLSCIRKGHVLNLPLQGIIVDQSGMNGLKGQVVMRNGPMLRNAGISGFLAGVGNGLSSSLLTTSTSPLGSTHTLPSTDVLTYGGYQGASTALSKLADYYIKLASLYHPVVEIHPGAIVDVLFLKGFSLNIDEKSKTTQPPKPPIQSHHWSSNKNDQKQMNDLMNRLKPKRLGESMEVSHA